MPLLLLGGGAVLLLASSGKKDDKKNGASGEVKDDPAQKSGKKDKPKELDDDPGFKKPKSEEEKQKELEAQEKAEQEAELKNILENPKYVYPKQLPQKYVDELKADHADGYFLYGYNTIWFSKDCKAVLFTPDWEPKVKALDGSTNMIDAQEFWRQYSNEIVGYPATPSDDYSGDNPPDVFFTRTNIMYWSDSDCAEQIPDFYAYATMEDLDNAWTAFYTKDSAVVQAYSFVIQKHAYEQMLEAFAEETPNAFYEWAVRDYARLAVAATDSEDLNEITDAAYFDFTTENPDAPKKLDPDDPSHEQYIQLWMDLYEAIEEILEE